MDLEIRERRLQRGCEGLGSGDMGVDVLAVEDARLPELPTLGIPRMAEPLDITVGIVVGDGTRQGAKVGAHILIPSLLDLQLEPLDEGVGLGVEIDPGKAASVTVSAVLAEAVALGTLGNPDGAYRQLSVDRCLVGLVEAELVDVVVGHWIPSC